MDEIIEKFKNLSEKERRKLMIILFDPALNIPEKSDKITTHEDIYNFHKYLVKCCKDYLKNTGNKEISNIYFNVTDIQSSVEFDDWHPSTDSSLSLESDGPEGREKLGTSW